MAPAQGRRRRFVGQDMIRNIRGFLHDLWALTRPYWVSEERWRALALLVVIIGMNLALVYVSVRINRYRNDFYNALQNKDYREFLHQLLVFVEVVTPAIVIAVYRQYLNSMLQIRWRRWLTQQFLGNWLAKQSYYRLQLTGGGTDNPDQRIADDLRLFVAQTLGLTLDFLSNAVSLVSFVGILWALSGTIVLPLGSLSIAIPGYMVWVALLYSAVGTWATHKIGRPLARLNFEQQRYEADFRFSLIRLRENAEGVALYGGEAPEAGVFRRRFGAVYDNWWAIMRRTKSLTWFTAAFGQLADLFPTVVAAPRYFSGAIQLGGLMQISSAFAYVQGSLSWFVDAYTDLASWKATVDRLTSFQAAIAAAERAGETGIIVGQAAGEQVALAGLAIDLPDGRPLLAPTDLGLRRGEAVLVTGPTGSGKSTLFRVLGGLWPFGRGRVDVPAGQRVLFLPQKPYLPLGTLRDAVSYPAPVGKLEDAAIQAALQACGLAHLVDRLDEDGNWSQRLSPGEQQRLAFARALLTRPDWLFLDEATSALDEATEAMLYRLVKERLPQATLVSIGHRSTLAAFHDRRLELQPAEAGGRLVDVPMAVAAVGS
jgi:vitamin B12/bleomycin/antimicrobial peptide transport system ATP-binding/permease protein